MKKINKIIIPILVVGLLISVALPVHASTEACNHVWATNITYPSGRVDTITSTTCNRLKVTTSTCNRCGEVEVAYEWITNPHDNVLINSSCNGSKQIYNYSCRYCGYNSLVTKACPSAGHAAGQCPNLNG